jgi:hypothetical protein
MDVWQNRRHTMNITWLKAAGMRALKTFAQTAVALIGTGAVGLLDVSWVGVGSGALLAAVLSMLTSIGGIPEVEAAPPRP